MAREGIARDAGRDAGRSLPAARQGTSWLSRIGAVPGVLCRWWERRSPHLVREVVREWRDDRASGLGAEIAFFGVLSVFPALLAIAAALGFLDRLIGSQLAMAARDQVIDFLRDMLSARAAEPVRAVRQLFEGERPGLVSVAMVATLWAVSRGVAAAIRALNIAYDLPEERSWLRTRLKALALAVATVALFVLILAVAVTGPLLGAGRVLREAITAPGTLMDVWAWLRYPLVFALILGWAVLLFHFGPNQRAPVRWELAGAGVTGVLWLASSVGFRLYVETVGDLNRVLGVLGGALILMLWLYLLSLSLLVGAEVNDVLRRRRGHERRPREVQPAPARS